MRVDTLTPVLDAAPGELVIGRVRVVNDGADDATFTMRVVGLDGQGVVYEVPGGPVGPGLSAEVDVPLEVPPALGVGQHAVALEVSSDRSDERPALARLTVSIDSLERVQLAPRPSTVRAGRSGRFTLDVLNNELTTVDVLLGGEAADVAVVFDPPMVRLHPGERGWVRGKIRAKQRWGGDSLHHVLTLTARGRSSTTSTTMAYIQRPVVPGKALNAMAAIVLIAMFLGAIGGGLWWWGQRDTTETATTPDGRLGQLDGVTTGADGSTGADGTAGGNGADPDGAGPGADGGADAPSGPGAIPTFTVVTGTVSTSDGSPAGVTVRLAPIDLGGQIDDDAAIVGVAGASRGPAKIWSARHAVRPSVMTPVRQTESVLPVTTDGDGVWRFVDIPIRQNYELVFSKAGYNTQSFVVTPPADGSRVELDVELEAATGQLSGVVVGPEGALGGVDIVVTDGDLTFRTTSATEASGTGQVGSFAIEGLNTPAVYTLSASLRGFGTEVVQLPFTAGQVRSGTTVSMQAGVGSVSGRVTTGGEPRGGVTITASNGDDTFTTTSLTEGDVGAYSIPRLDIPGEYTVTATLPGFITQTRRVVLSGNAAGTDFQLVPTTAGISGQVRSSNGNPIVGAGITVSVDDVGFRSATAASPVPGSFNIGDLPPGTYLVRISRFDHLPYSQQVTVGAGQTVDLGEITLEFSARPPIAALGSVAVRVFDSEDADLEGATVSIYGLSDRVGVDQPIRTINDTAGEQSTFVFDNVPIGTYRVRVTRPIYRTVERRVSVGLGRENVEVRMLRLGQASGQILTADNLPLRGYALNIYRLEATGVETLVESNVAVVSTRRPDDDGKILWESEPDSLVAGTYRIEVVNQPPGYEVAPNQVIDPSVTQTPASMLFRIPSDSEDPVEVDLVADPLPLIGGRLFIPRYSQAGGTTLRPLTSSEVSALPGLDITLVCGDVTVDADVPLVRPTPVEPYVGFELPELANHFEFTPFAIQDANARGDCRINVVADGFIDTSVPLTTPVRPSPAAPNPRQRTVNLALMELSNPLFGRVFWVDGNEQIDLVDVDISSDPDTVIGALPRQGTNFGDTTPPELRQESISTMSTAGGRWAFEDEAQLFGAATYTFRAADFADGLLEVVLDDGSNPAVAPTRTIREVGVDGDDAAIALRATVRPEDQGVDVELLAPDPGELSGLVEILTSRPVPAFDGVLRRAERAAQSPLTLDYDSPEPTPIPNPRRFSRENVPAGTWDVVFTLADNHDFFDRPDDPRPGTAELVSGPGDSDDQRRYRKRVEPGSGASGFNTTLVELGLVKVTVDFDEIDPDGDHGPTAPTTFRLESLDGEVLASLGPVTDTDATFARVPVHPAEPLDTQVGYELEVLRAGYDEDAAAITIRDRTDPTVNDPFPPITFGPAPGTSREILLEMVAGRDLEVEVTLPQYGTLTGTVIGRDASDDSDNRILRLDDRLVVAADRLDGSGQPVVDDRVEIVDSGDDATSFTLTGPPGTYRIAASHPFYESDPSTPGVLVPRDPPPAGEISDFEVVNVEARQIADPWSLPIKRAALDVTALGSFDGATRVPVADARVVLTPAGVHPDDAAADQLVVARTDAVGRVVIDDLLPGDYRMEIRRHPFTPDPDCSNPFILDPPAICATVGGTWDDSVDQAYPVIATVTVAPGDTAAERTTAVTVKLPSLTAQISGTIIAVNSDFDPGDSPETRNQVAVPQNITVNRTYQPSAVDLATGGTVPNTATDTGIVPVQKGSVSASPNTLGALERSFGFDFIPGGTHVLDFPVVAGFTLDGDEYTVTDAGRVEREVNVADTIDLDTNKPVNVRYRALDVDLEVTLTYPSSVLPRSPQVRLFPPGTDPNDPDDADAALIGVRVDGTTRFTFPDVVPRTSEYQYRLVVTDELARPSVGSDPIAIEITPNGDGSATPDDVGYSGPVQKATVEMVGFGGRISGSIQQETTPTSGTSNLAGLAVVVAKNILDSDDTYEDTIAAGSSSGVFSIDLPAGEYDVTIVKDEFVSNTVRITATNGVPTTTTTVLTARKQGTATITIVNAPTTAGDTTVTVVGYPVSAPAQTFAGERTGNQWKFTGLVPGTPYRFEASRAGYYRVIFPSATTSYTPKIGESMPYSTTLRQRRLTVDVTGPTTGNVSAALQFGSVSVSRSQPADASGVTSLVFTSTDTGTGVVPLPLVGGSDIVVSAPGFRQRTLSGTDALPNVTSDVLPVASTGDVATTRSLTLQPVVTEITGAITGTDQSVPVTLRRGETVVETKSSTVTTDPVTNAVTNTFSFTAVTGSSFDVGTYTASVAVLGVGTGTVTLEIQPTTPTGSSVAFPQPVEVVARTVSVTFNGLPGSSVTTTVTFPDGEPATASSTGTSITFTRNERNVAGEYTVSAPGRIWRKVTLTLTAEAVSSGITVDNVTLDAFPSFSGKITDAAGAGIGGVTVKLYAGECGPAGDVLGEVTSRSTGGGGGEPTGNYVDLISGPGGFVGKYCIAATTNGLAGSLTVDVPTATTTGKDFQLVAPEESEDDD